MRLRASLFPWLSLLSDETVQGIGHIIRYAALIERPTPHGAIIDTQHPGRPEL
jgi:hypothetical protein